MNVPSGGHTEVNDDGSATVYDRDSDPVRRVARPWAFDSAGRPQKTWYEVGDNGDLIQHVEPAENALYPILADPTDEQIAAGAIGGAYAGPVGAAAALAAPKPVADTSGASQDWAGAAAEQQGDEVLQNSPDLATQQPSPAPAPDATDNSGTTSVLPFGVKTQPVPKGAIREVPGQNVPWTDVVLGAMGAEPPAGRLYERQGPDGNTEYFRREANPDGTTTDVPVVSTESQDDGVVYRFGDGRYQQNGEVYRPDGLKESPSEIEKAMFPGAYQETRESGTETLLGGQDVTFEQAMRVLLLGEKLDGKAYERVAEDGSHEYFLRTKDEQGNEKEKRITGFGFAMEDQRVFEFEDGTAITMYGEPVEKDDQGNFWIVRDIDESHSTRTAIIDGRKITIRRTVRPDGSYVEYDNNGHARAYSPNGVLIDSRQLDDGNVYDDAMLGKAVLGTAISLVPGGKVIGKAGKAILSAGQYLYNRLGRSETEKPDKGRPNPLGPRRGSKPPSVERNREVVEKSPEGGRSKSDVIARGAGTIKKGGDAIAKTQHNLTAPQVGVPSGVNPGGVGLPPVQGGSLILAVFAIVAILRYLLERILKGGK
ncbi:MAG: hypothetical protein QM658_01050 [Gordonia sp. (in: high G+C Gram-positive bacteria)]